MVFGWGQEPDPEKAETARDLYERGVSLLDAGNRTEALDALAQAAEAGGASHTPEGYLTRARALVERARGLPDGEAARVLQDAVEAASEADSPEGTALAAEAAVRRAHRLLDADRREDAVSTLDKARSMADGAGRRDLAAHAAYRRAAALAREDPQEALADARTARTLAERLEAPFGPAVAIRTDLARAATLRAEGRFEAALEAARQARDEADDAARREAVLQAQAAWLATLARLQAAVILTDLGRGGQALETLEEAVDVGGGRGPRASRAAARASWCRAEALAEQGEIEAADEAHERGRRLARVADTAPAAETGARLQLARAQRHRQRGEDEAASEAYAEAARLGEAAGTTSGATLAQAARSRNVSLASGLDRDYEVPEPPAPGPPPAPSLDPPEGRVDPAPPPAREPEEHEVTPPSEPPTYEPEAPKRPEPAPPASGSPGRTDGGSGAGPEAPPDPDPGPQPEPRPRADPDPEPEPTPDPEPAAAEPDGHPDLASDADERPAAEAEPAEEAPEEQPADPWGEPVDIEEDLASREPAPAEDPPPEEPAPAPDEEPDRTRDRGTAAGRDPLRAGAPGEPAEEVDDEGTEHAVEAARAAARDPGEVDVEAGTSTRAALVDRAETLRELALARDDEDRLEAALGAIEAALDHDPRDPDLLHRRASLRATLASWRDDEAALEDALATFESAFDAHGGRVDPATHQPGPAFFFDWGAATYQLARRREDPALHESARERLATGYEMTPRGARHQIAAAQMARCRFGAARHRGNADAYQAVVDRYEALGEDAPFALEAEDHATWARALHRLSRLRGDADLAREAYRRMAEAYERS
jgi:tetratricopeptide (TPR) repeat protein